jgi:predicted ATPase
VLRRVLITSFRSLLSFDVPLRPLTVLIGLSDTGKSSFLQALWKLGNQVLLDAPTDRWRLAANSRPDIHGWDARGQEGWISTSKGPIESIMPTHLYQLPSDGVSMVSPGYPDQGAPRQLEQNGSGVPSLLDYLLRRDRKRFFDAVESMKRLINGLQDIEVRTPDPGSRSLHLVLEDRFRLPADLASGGVRLMIFFIALTFHPDPPKLILLEEPEMGVHPRRLGEIVSLLREITKGTHGGHPAQIVLTTHSPYLLDNVDLDEDQVLVFQRDEDGSRSAEPADAERLRLFLDEFMLGEVWYNQGEEGLIRR